MSTRTPVAAKASLGRDEKRARAASAAAPLGMHIAEALSIPLLVLQQNLRVFFANRAFLTTYKLEQSAVEHHLVRRLRGHGWNAPQFISALKRVAAGHVDSEQLEFQQTLRRGDPRRVSVRIQAIDPGDQRKLLITVDDVTARNRATLEAEEAEKTLKRTAAASASELRRAERSLKAEVLGRTEAETALDDANTALILSREQLRALTASLLDAQEAERRHLSREIHDDLSQKVAKLQFDLETLAQQQASAHDGFRNRLLAIRDEVVGLADDLRGLAHRLHPSTLEHLGLAVALRSYVRDLSERESVRVEITIRRMPKKIPTEIATSLYRVVQEALRNVVKHAGNADTAITLDGSSTQVRLTIRDHGPGFDVDAVQRSGGLGLISMQERVRLVHGDFSLRTRPGQGVVIKIRVPLGRES